MECFYTVVKALSFPEKSFITGEGYAFSLQPDGSCYAFGENGYRQLGLPKFNYKEWVALELPVKPRKIRAGSNSTVLITERGELYLTGRIIETCSDLRIPLEESISHTWNLVKTPDYRFRDCALGYLHALFLTENGSCLVSGTNSDGQLGLGLALYASWKEIWTPFPLQEIACAGYHSLFLTETGVAYETGKLQQGKDYQTFWNKITLPSREVVEKLTVGFYSAFLFGKSGKCYGRGDHSVPALHTSTRVPNDLWSLLPYPRLKKVIPSLFCTLLLTEKGECYYLRDRIVYEDHSSYSAFREPAFLLAEEIEEVIMGDYVPTLFSKTGMCLQDDWNVIFQRHDYPPTRLPLRHKFYAPLP